MEARGPRRPVRSRDNSASKHERQAGAAWRAHLLRGSGPAGQALGPDHATHAGWPPLDRQRWRVRQPSRSIGTRWPLHPGEVLPLGILNRQLSFWTRRSRRT
jgi:hypothetical protein